MTAEQLLIRLEEIGWVEMSDRERKLARIKLCNDWREAYAAHVREAAQREIDRLECEVADAHLNCPADDLEAQLEVARTFKEDNIKLYGELEAAERKLAEVEKVLLALLAETCGCSSSDPNWHSSRCRMPKIEAALASLRAESKEG